ncbi:hypothetical protein [Moorena sp. SIO3H5]|uniref:DUF4139 domain-containing protein n=1 Tax=Moorena sp. SIO3H5 TaxID=2607834 RepID=UPI0013BDB898|nr:hypothetical protein [Moorena sp. SIO3H5]NEO72109.1 hypothetical protein [Moorena sp. SIO3H5]
MADNPIISTAKQSQGFSLTIYNQNFAVVREQRQLSLNQGTNLVRYEDVAAQIDPTSISFKSVTAPNSVMVREQNYQYDLLNPTTILNKSVGKTIRFRRVNPDGQIEILVGTLLNPPEVTVASQNSGGGSTRSQTLAIRLPNGNVVLNPSGEMELNEMPEGLVSRPSLVWKLQVSQAGDHATEVSYIANAITWKADYVAVVSEDESKVDITGWVTLENRSGATYENSQLQLIAGDVRRVEESQQAEVMRLESLWGGSIQPQFEEETFFEYHLYTLDGTTTVQNNETKQMTLLSAADVEVHRKLIFDSSKNWHYSSTKRPGKGEESYQDKVNVILDLANTKTNNMGMPLPKGKVRVYKADRRGNLQFLGEDLIDHTPKNEVVSLYIGDSFDVVGDRKRRAYKQIAKKVTEESIEISIRNRKEDQAQVWVVERFSGDWEILRSNHTYNQLDAKTVEFPISINPGEEVKITYSVMIKY